MPTYVYAVINDDGSLGEHFELQQRMTDDALTEHPETGAPVKRVPQAPNIGGDYNSISENNKISDSNLDRLGFTKYVNEGGKFGKAVGKGPDTLTP